MLLFKQLSLSFFAAILTGCATVNFDYPKTDSRVFADTSETYFAKHLVDDLANHPVDQSGFYLLPDGIEALSARLMMAARAERSIDAQYYEIKRGTVGKAFIMALLQAADRGVRVRLLIDDVNTQGYDAGMAGLDSHPNFEIRVFNPFANRTFRKLDALKNFSRINRRMHNKSFTVDNQITVFGGRNIGDEYFGAIKEAIFFDLDVLAVGSVVNSVSSMFDAYWNHERAVPLEAFARLPDDPAAELVHIRGEIAQWQNDVGKTKYANAVKESYWQFVESDTSIFTWAPYQLVYDMPDKAIKERAGETMLIKTAIYGSLEAAQEELTIVSPYFVPLQSGIDWLVDAQARGVDINIVTNAHSANNQALVHAGYAPARKPLLRGGVKIYEVRPDAEVADYEVVELSSAKATLHTKAYIVDRKEIFIGSFNFDPRSANINTELGVLIQSPLYAAEIARNIEKALPEISFELFLNERDGLRWRSCEEGKEIIFNKEPHTSWWQRMYGRFLQILPIKSQL